MSKDLSFWAIIWLPLKFWTRVQRVLSSSALAALKCCINHLIINRPWSCWVNLCWKVVVLSIWYISCLSLEFCTFYKDSKTSFLLSLNWVPLIGALYKFSEWICDFTLLIGCAWSGMWSEFSCSSCKRCMRQSSSCNRFIQVLVFITYCQVKVISWLSLNCLEAKISFFWRIALYNNNAQFLLPSCAIKLSCAALVTCKSEVLNMPEV